MVQNLPLRYAGRYAAAVALLLMGTAAHAQEAFDTPEECGDGSDHRREEMVTN